MRLGLFRGFFFSIILLSNVFVISGVIPDHLIFHFTDEPKDYQEHAKWRNMIHNAVDEISNKAFKYSHRSQEILQEHTHSQTYIHKKDHVFLVRFGHASGTYTLHKPSYVTFEQLSKIVKSVFKSKKLKVAIDHDYEVTHSAVNIGYEGKAFALDELQKYAGMTDHDFDVKINALQKEALSEHASKDIVTKIEKLQKIQEMRKLFFWHLQNPTVGLLDGGSEFDIADDFKPLSWHFLLWDLAPKKGTGVRVAVIDTGMSAFDLEHYKKNSSGNSIIEKDKQYKKNQSLTFDKTALQYYGYDLVSENGLDPVEQLAINIMQYCDHLKFSYNDLIKNLPIWIKEFLTSKNSYHIEEFLINSGKKGLADKNHHLTINGQKVLKDVLYGDYGILPKGETKFFEIVHLEAPYNDEAILQILPAPKITKNNETFIAGHGSFTSGIIGGQEIRTNPFVGIAPQAEVIMIKAFKDDGSTNKSTLNASLERAKMIDAGIVSMSLKITDSFNKHNQTDQTLERLINGFDYVVAASGNNGEPGGANYAGKKEAFPAKFKTVAFDVGAFSYDDGKYPVSPFTQREPNIGPKFAAPGFNLLAPGLKPSQTIDSNYVFMGGTSVAVPVVSGILALILAEFQTEFYREELLQVIYKSAIKMNASSQWQQDILLGAIDARSSLLCLHVLSKFKKMLKDKQKSSESKLLKDFSWEDKFENLVEAVYTVMFYLPLYYGKVFKVAFNKDFVGFCKKIDTQRVAHQRYFKPVKKGQKGVEETVEFVTHLLFDVLEDKVDEKDDDLDSQLVSSLKTILTGEIHLFEHLSQSIQDRIYDVLHAEHPETSYWTK